MSLEPRTLERIAREFPTADQASVAELFTRYSGPEAPRVVWDILDLSKGSLEKAKRFLDAARIDYRDVLYWAEYQATDPMLKDQDPKQLIDGLISKLRKAKQQ